MRISKTRSAAFLTVASLLLVSISAFVHAASADLSSDEAERISFILGTQLYPDTLEANSTFGLQSIAFVGQNIGGSLPSTPSSEEKREHVVGVGETLGEIAAQYDLASVDFLNANPSLESRDVIFPGQVLTVPQNAASPEEVAKLKKDLEKKQKEKQLAAAKKATTTTKNRKLATASTEPTTGKYTMPVRYKYISQSFMENGHDGVDMVASIGTPVRATATGCVIHAATGWNGGYGTVIIIKHSGSNLSSLYGHLSKLQVSVGDCVDAGTQIGESGSTGRSTGPHLHFEIRSNGSKVNPMKYL